MGRPTIRTVAQAVGVAPNTVSLALQDSPLVANETKRKVLEEAERQGYQRDALAQALRSGRSHSIALAFVDVANPLFAMRIKALSLAFRKLNYQTFILNTDEDAALEALLLRSAVERKADGVVLCPCQGDRAGLTMLQRAGIPCVLVGRQFQKPQEDAVVWDDQMGGRLATEFLLSKGCRRILHLTASHDVSSSFLRMSGYREAIENKGLAFDPALIVKASSMGGIEESLAGAPSDYDGLFAFNDLLAWEAMSLGVALPTVGFDNIQAYLRLPMKLSSISADLELETQWITELLMRRIKEPDRAYETRVLPVSLVERD
ncbi:MAG: LacI family DNA-binding transcriptional regulator [Eubacteriales bacterium]|nr:LacI family DNA-binding transcriptional regulator [Eubacteriales bacterium]